MEIVIEHAQLHVEILKQDRKSFIEALHYLVSIGAKIKVTKISSNERPEEIIKKESFDTWFKI